MSSSSTVKSKSASKERSVTKMGKWNTIQSDIASLKIALSDVLKNKCEPKIKCIYQDAFGNKVKGSSKEDDRFHCPVITLVLDNSHKQVLTGFVWKHFVLNKTLFDHVTLFCQKYSTLSSIRIEDAKLEEKEIDILTDFLAENINVIELNISGNAYHPNFSTLICRSKLKYLTLRFCGITSEHLKVILKPLKDCYFPSLVHLNLSNNKIDSDGAKEISDLLRGNRTMISLNLSGNKIDNEGAKYILATMKLFYLNKEEISKRRKIYYQYYIKKYLEMKKDIPPTSNASEEQGFISSSSTSNVEARARSKSLSKGRGRVPKKLSKSSVNNAPGYTRNVPSKHGMSTAPPPTPYMSMAVPNMSDLQSILDCSLVRHPFIMETKLEGLTFACRGNFALTQLNLSYNKLTSEILAEFKAVLEYQISSGTRDEGLRNINLRGNTFEFEKYHQWEHEFSYLMTAKDLLTSTDTIQLEAKDESVKDKRNSNENPKNDGSNNN